MIKKLLAIAATILFPVISFAQTQSGRVQLSSNAALEQQYAAGASIVGGQLVKLQNGSTTINGVVYANVIPTATTDTTGILGVADNSAASGSLLNIRLQGQGPIFVDAAACIISSTLQNSPTIAGSATCSGTGQIVGYSLSASSGAGIINASITSSGGGGGGGGSAPGSPNLSLQTNCSTLFCGVAGSSYNSLTGALNISSVGNIALKVFATDGIRYASPSGNDSNDGLSWGTAKLTVLGACESLPNGSSSPATCGSGTVQFMDLTFAQPTSTCGFDLMGSADPNFSSPPACWIKWGGGSHGLAIVGVPSRANGPNPKEARALMQGGSSADRNHPGIYLSALSGAVSFHNLSVQFPGRGIVVGECSNQTRTATCNTSNITFDNVTANINDVSGNGPTWDITGQSFWIWIINGSGAGGTDDTNSPTSDNAAAVLLDGRTNAGVGLIFITDFFTSNGGIKLYAGTNFGQVVVRNMTTEGQKGEPAVWIAATGGSGDTNVTANISDVQIADATTSSPGVQNDITNGSSILASDIEGATINVAGHVTILSQYPGNLLAQTVSPLSSGQTGFFVKTVVGENGDLDHLFPPVQVRYPNIASTSSSSWLTSFAGSTTSVASCADPAGGTLAGCISYVSGGTGETAAYYLANTSLTVGDWYAITADVKSTTANGYSGNTPIEFVLNAQGFGSGDFCNGTSSGIVSATSFFRGDGQWDRVWAICKVSAASTNAGIAMVALTDATHNIAVYGPTLIHISAGTVSNDEAWNVASALQPYSNLCTAGQLCNVTGNIGGGTINNPLGNFSKGESLVAQSSTTGAMSSPSSWDIAPFTTGADWSANAQLVLAAAGNANARVSLTASGASPASCVNPFANTTGGLEVYLPYVPIFLNCSTSSWVISGNDTDIVGAGGTTNTTRLNAGGGFTGTTPMLQLGTSGVQSFGLSASRLSINCFNAPTTGGGTTGTCVPFVAYNLNEFSVENQLNFIGQDITIPGYTGVATFNGTSLQGHFLAENMSCGDSGVADCYDILSKGNGGGMFFRWTANDTGKVNEGKSAMHWESISAANTFSYSLGGHAENFINTCEFDAHTGGACSYADSTGVNTNVLLIHSGALSVLGEFLSCSGTNIVNDSSVTPNVVIPCSSYPNGLAIYTNSDIIAKDLIANSSITDSGLSAGNVCSNSSGLLFTAGCTGGGPGTGTQYALAYWSSTSSLGSALGTVSGQVVIAQNGAAPVFASAGIGGNPNISAATYTVQCDSTTTTIDRGHTLIFTNGSGATVTIPDAGSTGCGSNFSFAVGVGAGAGTITFNRNSASTFLILNGSTVLSAQVTMNLTPGQYATFSSPDNINYLVRAVTGGGGGSGTPCTVTPGSLQFDSSGAFGCTTPFTYASNTITAAAAGILNLSAATGTAAFVVPVNAGNTATAPGVIDFDSTNKNYHGYVNGADSIFANFASAPATNCVIKSSVSSGNTLLVCSGMTDNATTISTSETFTFNGSTSGSSVLSVSATGGVLNVNGPLSVGSSAPACTGGSAGGVCYTEGTAPNNVSGAAALYPDSTAHEFEGATNGTNSYGIFNRTRPSPIHQTGQTSAISTATLCASSAGACNVAGQYKIHFDFIETGTACSSPSTGGVTFLLTWTDTNGTAHSAVSLGMEDATTITSVSQTFHFQTSLAAAWASGDFSVSTNGSVIQYATGYTACGTGTGTYQLDASVVRVF